jgi:hypothetical protein
MSGHAGLEDDDTIPAGELLKGALASLVTLLCSVGQTVVFD